MVGGIEDQDSSVAGGDSRLESVPLHSTNLLTVLDEDGIIRYESPAIECIFGFDQEDIIGDPVAEYIHPDDRDAVLGAFQTIVSSEERVMESVEYRHKNAAGSYEWVESVGSSNPTPEDEYVINTQDISDRREREQELERKNEQLEEFASVLSHDLRNPLQVAQGRLELATEECDSDHLAAVEEAHDRMHALVDDLLQLAKQGREVSEMEPVELETVTNACWGNVASGDVKLVNNADDVILADKSRLKQLLENLFRNSIEHTRDGVTVTVGTIENGFYVEDDGPGIPEEDRDIVFQTGYSTSEEGTGFGLDIVQQVADAHDWDIHVTESTAGGVRFEFRGVEFGE